MSSQSNTRFSTQTFRLALSPTATVDVTFRRKGPLTFCWPAHSGIPSGSCNLRRYPAFDIEGGFEGLVECSVVPRNVRRNTDGSLDVA